jgi:hypothetical protein
MKTTHWLLCRTGFALLFFWSASLFGQVREPFEDLDLSPITSGFFYPQTNKDIPVPDPYSFNDTISSQKALALINYFDRACLNEHAYIDDFGNFTHAIFEQAKTENCYPISMLDIHYHDFDTDVTLQNYIAFNGTKFQNVPGTNGNPYEEKAACISWIGAETFESNVIKFKLSSQHFITNKQSLPAKIYIDFDDDLGYRLIHFDEIITVDYSSFTTDRYIKTILQHSGSDDTKSITRIKYAISFRPCETTQFPFPSTPPWLETDTQTLLDPDMEEGRQISPWFISVPYESRFVKANAFTLTSEDGVFDKPFIFVEGIDFGRDNNMTLIHEIYQNGTFGWCQFSSGFLDPNPEDTDDYGYDMLHLMPGFLNELRENGYDIVLVDFWDGTELMQINAAIVERVINLCNENKTGGVPLVVAGASMGGQITRYALRNMELNGTDPCTRLWISLDSPHAGANIPAALMEAIDFNADMGTLEAVQSREFYMQSNASRQLLNYQLNGDLSLRNEWYATLDQMGYPESCRSIAISNGMGNGTPVHPTPSPLMDFSCEIVEQEVLKQYLFPNSGNPLMLGPGGFLLASFKHLIYGTQAASDISLQEIVNLFYSWTGAVNVYFDVESRQVYTPIGQYNLDFAPGGTRESVRAYYFEVKSSINESAIGEFCEIEESNILNKHSFVSSMSSVGISGLDPTLNLVEFLEDYDEFKHFDRIEFAPIENEEHTKITEHNIQIILEEVLSYDNMQGFNELTSQSENNGTFNFGKEGYNAIHSMHVHNGGSLLVHRHLPTHFASETDITEPNVFFEVNTLTCNPAEILVDQNGALEIGDPDIEDRHANLVLERDSRLTIGEGGTLKVFKGSRLIVNEGAELIVYPGAQVLLDNGIIVLHEGGKLIIKAGTSPGTINSIKLHHDEAAIVIEGGQILIEDNTQFAISHDNVNSGYIRVLPGTSNALINGINSRFILNGDQPNDLMLMINDGAIFESAHDQDGFIELNNCKVDLTNGGQLITKLKFTADNVKFVTENSSSNNVGGSLRLSKRNPLIKNSIFEHVNIANSNCFFSMETSTLTGPFSGFNCANGGYDIKTSTFQDCNLLSEGLQMVSTVTECHFNDASHNQIYDYSLAELRIRHCTFEATYTLPALQKRGGKLSVFCSEFNSFIGVKVIDGELNLCGTDQAGYNDFVDTDKCIVLDGATWLKLNKGYNDFSGDHYRIISGTMNLPCLQNTGCESYIQAQNNFWGYIDPNAFQLSGSNLALPDQNDFSIFTITTGNCGNSLSCRKLIKDTSPIVPDGCPRLRPIEVKSSIMDQPHFTEITVNENTGMRKSDNEDPTTPNINTFHFQNIALDSALIFAAMQMESYDSLGNDAFALELFHEILLDSLDQSNGEVKRKMNWGRYNMKSTMENMFAQEELYALNNETTFEIPVQHYVDVLNLMTETELSDSTYRMQFYLELDKGQFFRTLGKPQITQQIFTHLNECQLDSMEQSVLNAWRQQIDLELNYLHQTEVLNIPVDSINNSVDTSNYSTPISLDISDYYFGLWIDSPNEITFVSCGEDPVYRLATEENSAYRIYPNPASDHLKIRNFNGGKTIKIEIHDISGKCIYSSEVQDLAENRELDIALPSNLSNGNYIMRIKSDLLTEDHRLVIFK